MQSIQNYLVSNLPEWIAISFVLALIFFIIANWSDFLAYVHTRMDAYGTIMALVTAVSLLIVSAV